MAGAQPRSQEALNWISSLERFPLCFSSDPLMDCRHIRSAHGSRGRCWHILLLSLVSVTIVHPSEEAACSRVKRRLRQTGAWSNGSLQGTEQKCWGERLWEVFKLQPDCRQIAEHKSQNHMSPWQGPEARLHNRLLLRFLRAKRTGVTGTEGRGQAPGTLSPACLISPCWLHPAVFT